MPMVKPLRQGGPFAAALGDVAGALDVSGTVGKNLQVTSTGAVTTATPSTVLTVDGAGTSTANPHVTVKLAAISCVPMSR